MVFPKNIRQTVFHDSLPEIVTTATHNLSIQMPRQKWSQAVAEDGRGGKSQANIAQPVLDQYKNSLRQAQANLVLDQYKPAWLACKASQAQISQAYLLSPCSNQARRENSPSWLARSSFFTIFIFFFHHIIQLFVLDKSCFIIFFISCQISKIMFWGKMG